MRGNRGIESGCGYNPSGAVQRINTPECAAYVKTVFEEAMREKLSGIKLPAPELLRPFGNIYMEDSTQASVHEKLAEEFKGSGGSAGAAAVKIDCIYNIKKAEIARVALRPGADSDQGPAAAMNKIMKAGDLRIAGQGYFSIPAMKEAAGMGAFYLSRLSKSADIYLNIDDPAPANLPEYLNTRFAGAAVIDFDVYIGKEERFKTRLIAYRLQQEIVSERRRKARKNAKRKGRAPAKDYMAWLEFSFFVANVSAETWPAETVGTIYRIRRQIELIFWNWKSLLNIHVLKGFKPERIQCLIYAKPAAAVLMTPVYSYSAFREASLYERETGFFKLIGRLKRNMRFKLLSANPENIPAALDNTLPRLRKQKRKRKTTLELIETGAAYLDTLAERIQPDKTDVKKV